MEYLIAFILGYFALLAGLSFAARPARLRMKRLATELLAEHRYDADVTEYLQHQLATAYSWRAAPIDTFVMIAALIVPARVFWEKARKVEAEHPVMFSDPRFYRFDNDYTLSIAAVNPLFGVLMYAANVLIVLKLMAFAKRADVRRQIPPIGMMNPA